MRYRPTIIERATNLLEGDRADGVEAGVVFPPAGAPHSAVGPRSSNVQRTC